MGVRLSTLVHCIGQIWSDNHMSNVEVGRLVFSVGGVRKSLEGLLKFSVSDD